MSGWRREEKRREWRKGEKSIVEKIREEHSREE